MQKFACQAVSQIGNPDLRSTPPALEVNTTIDLPVGRQSIPADLPQYAAMLSLLQQIVDGQQRIIELLERGRGARDQADVALLLAVAEALGDRQFTSAALVAHAEADLALRQALVGADISTTRELGCLLRRLEGSVLSGLRLERMGDQRAGVVWRVQVSED